MEVKVEAKVTTEEVSELNWIMHHGAARRSFVFGCCLGDAVFGRTRQTRIQSGQRGRGSGSQATLRCSPSEFQGS